MIKTLTASQALHGASRADVQQKTVLLNTLLVRAIDGAAKIERVSV